MLASSPQQSRSRWFSRCRTRCVCCPYLQCKQRSPTFSGGHPLLPLLKRRPKVVTPLSNLQQAHCKHAQEVKTPIHKKKNNTCLWYWFSLWRNLHLQFYIKVVFYTVPFNICKILLINVPIKVTTKKSKSKGPKNWFQGRSGPPDDAGPPLPATWGLLWPPCGLPQGSFLLPLI